jgi:uncharacterized membrane protein (DUF2068 family)
MTERESRPAALTLIALFRLTKALVLTAAVFGVLKLIDPDVAAHVHSWLATLPFVDHYPEWQSAARRLTSASRRRLEIVAAVAAAYAVLFAVEGVGLWLRKVWAEYLTIVATTSFVPFEIYEVARRFTPLRLGALVVNVAIVAYLVVRRVRAHRRGRGGDGGVRSRLASAITR